MFVVGVTGGIGSGKSTVADLLGQHGARVVDVDAIARDVTADGSPALREIAEHFGDGVLTPDGSLDRAGMAARVFADGAQRETLEAITHPRIRRRLHARLAELDAEGAEIVVVDHPLLVETSSHTACDAVVVVTAPSQTRVERLVARGMDRADAQARMAAQADDDRRREVATWVVDNGGDPQELTARVEDVHQGIRAAAAGRSTRQPR